MTISRGFARSEARSVGRRSADRPSELVGGGLRGSDCGKGRGPVSLSWRLQGACAGLRNAPRRVGASMAQESRTGKSRPPRTQRRKTHHSLTQASSARRDEMCQVDVRRQCAVWGTCRVANNILVNIAHVSLTRTPNHVTRRRLYSLLFTLYTHPIGSPGPRWRRGRGAPVCSEPTGRTLCGPSPPKR